MAKKKEELSPIDKTLAKIYDEITWYNSYGIRTQNINAIMLSKDKLAIYSYGLAQFCSEMKYEYNSAYFIRKINVSKSIQGMMSNESYSKAKADNEAQILHEKLLKDELEKEASSFKLDLLLRQVNVIIQSMQQRISFLRVELETTNMQQLT